MRSIFGGLTNDQWNQEVYTEGTTWTIRNVLAHFVTSERGLIKLFEQIRQGGAALRTISPSTATMPPCRSEPEGNERPGIAGAVQAECVPIG
jgi:hypothetical protein